MALAPWPPSTSVAGLANAIATLSAAINSTEVKAARLGPVAAALVEKYAPGAPQAVKDESVIRCSGWLSQTGFVNEKSKKIGDMVVERSPSMRTALRHSGATGLLAPWRVHGAGVITK